MPPKITDKMLPKLLELFLEPLDIPSEASIPLSGNYTNKVLVLHDMANGLEGKPEHTLLQKIMQAVKVSLESIGIINVHEWEEASLEQAIAQLQPQAIICFGEQNMPNHQALPSLYELGNINGCQILRADSLSLVNSDVEKKKQLWTALQLMFK